MHIRVIPTKSGSADSALSYLMSTHDAAGRERQVAPVPVSGSIGRFRRLCAALPFRRSYTSFSINFGEKVSLDFLRKAEKEFLNAILPGMQGRYSYVTVVHQDENQLHAHILVANVDLVTAKQMTVYFHAADNRLLKSFCEDFHGRNPGLKNPDDPSHARWAAAAPRKFSRKQRDVYEKIVATCARAVYQGCKDREELLSRLRIVKIEIISVSSNAITFRAGGEEVRIKGGIFSSKWRSGLGNRAGIARAAQEWDCDAQKRRIEAASKFSEALKNKLFRIRKRYPEVRSSILENIITIPNDLFLERPIPESGEAEFASASGGGHMVSNVPNSKSSGSGNVQSWGSVGDGGNNDAALTAGALPHSEIDEFQAFLSAE